MPKMNALSLFDVGPITLDETDRAKRLSQYFTPPKLARKIAAWSRVEGLRVLEPSAGGGALAVALRDAGADVLCAEIDPRYSAPLVARDGFTVACGSFLEMTPRGTFGRFDAVIQNPPYESGLDGEFMAHALLFAPRVVALVRLAALVGKGRHASLWSVARITRLALCVSRPSFTGELAGDGAKSDFCVVEFVRGGSVDLDATGPQTIEHWDEDWSLDERSPPAAPRPMQRQASGALPQSTRAATILLDARRCRL